MTDSPSETTEETQEPQEPQGPSELEQRAAAVAAAVGGSSWTAEHGTVKISVDRDAWVDAHRTLKPDMPYFSWLSAIDWASEVAVGDPPEEGVEEGFEVLSMVGSVTDGSTVLLSARIPKSSPSMPSLIGVYGGAEWHEREAHEMFGITFDGHPDLTHLYLPDGFQGHPLRKTFPLLSREVKPWPGLVDVEDMPSTENEEAGDGPAGEGTAVETPPAEKAEVAGSDVEASNTVDDVATGGEEE